MRVVLPTLSAKLRKIKEILTRFFKKYCFTPAFSVMTLILMAVLCSPSNAFAGGLAETAISYAEIVSAQDSTTVQRTRRPRRTERLQNADSTAKADSLPTLSDYTPIFEEESVVADTAKKKKAFLDDIVYGKNKDSLIYDVRAGKIYIYSEGDVKYQRMNLKADYMVMAVNNKEIFARGFEEDTTRGIKHVRPEFIDGGSNYTMDSMTYNMKSSKANIHGVATKDGEGFLIGRKVKKMPDNSINLAGGKYTTCDHTDHPHFYIQMTKAKVIPGKKVITGPAYFVMEDVPLYFVGLPGGFFPISNGPKSGFIMPSYGEESSRGFYLRDGGYYFTFGEHADLTLLGGIYTLGSWQVSATSRYSVRYKFSGNFNANYARTVTDGEGVGNFKVTWTHQQDPKFRPSSSFSANVNFATAGYNKQASTNALESANTQTNSSIAYSKSWSGRFAGSFSTNMQLSQNSRNKTIAASLPSAVFNISRFNPFKRQNPVGKERWYEKISMSYSATMTNSVSTTEDELFTRETLLKMKNGIQHSIPVSASFNLLKYISLSPSFNYTARWYFKKERKEWDPVNRTLVTLDPDWGFYHLHNWNLSASASTKLYGMMSFAGRDPIIRAIRHVVTPQMSFSFAPDFSKMKHGYYEVVQSDSTGRFQTYSPYSNNAYGVPGSGRTGSLTFSVANTLEMKVRSRTDSTGVKKIKLIDNFSFGGSYNFLADSLNLSNISLNLRTTLYGNFGLNLSAVLDMYKVDKNGRKINQFNIGNGKFGRIASTGWSFGYTFNSKKATQPALNDINSGALMYLNPFDTSIDIDPHMRRQMMAATYYDFSIPWNLGFSYSISYTDNGIKKNVTQSVQFNGSVNLTPKWGISFNGGYDIKARKLSIGTFSLSRDLHCWQMNFNWTPIGTCKGWSFHIGVKSSLLQDLKYDKSRSRFDSLYDD